MIWLITLSFYLFSLSVYFRLLHPLWLVISSFLKSITSFIFVILCDKHRKHKEKAFGHGPLQFYNRIWFHFIERLNNCINLQLKLSFSNHSVFQSKRHTVWFTVNDQGIRCITFLLRFCFLFRSKLKRARAYVSCCV